MNPSQIKRLDDGIEITWANGEKNIISSLTLRKLCPCATCNERRGSTSHAKPLQSSGLSRLKVVASTKEEETQLVSIATVGNYAINLRWGDGHNTGIYSFTALRELAKEA